MATKNSFFSHAAKPITWVATSAAFILLLTACNGLQTREDQASGRRPVAPETRPTPVEPVTSAPITSTQPNQPPPVMQPTPPPVSTPKPGFLAKELPRVGLILGPGGMKTFAEIGVLRELMRAKVPIRAIVGLEWGAVIGSLYAQQGQVNEVEWKAFKLKDSDLPDGSGGFLSSGLKPESVGTLNEFFDTVYGAAEIENGKVDFACPAYWSKTDQFGFMSRGPVKAALRACLPYPPLIAENAGVRAAPNSVEEASNYLRSRGANLVILVNVLGQGEFLPAKIAASQPSDNLLWSEIRRELMRPHTNFVQFTINVNTTGHPITDYAGRRQLLEIGAKASSDVINRLSSQYGF